METGKYPGVFVKRNLILAILVIAALTGVAVLYVPKSVPPPSQPQVAEQPQPPVQQAQPVITPAPLPPPTVSPEQPATPEAPAVATSIPDADSQNVALLPGLPIPLPPPRPKPPGSDEPVPELAVSQIRKGSPVFIRIFKRESALELWVHQEGRYRFVKKYPICAWSGALGPKIQTGDGQAPEGFYAVTRKQLNPNSAYYRAFNVGYPNAYDTQLGRTGSALMVHGACASVGCYAMTDPGIGEIYPLVEAALNSGQKAIPVHIFPFRMNDAALQAQVKSPWYGFWASLKAGYDRFEKSRVPPEAFACNGRYVLDAKEAAQPGCQKITGWL